MAFSLFWRLFVFGCLWAAGLAYWGHDDFPRQPPAVKSFPFHPRDAPSPKDRCEKIEYLFLEFNSPAPVEKLRQSFRHVNVIYSFKVYGANDYIVLLENDQSEALKNFRLPRDTKLFRSPFPVETFEIFLAHLGIFENFGNFLKDFPDKDLTFFEREWAAEGFSETQYTGALNEHIRRVRKNTNRLGATVFIATATLPTRFLFFMNRRDCFLTDVLLRNTDAIGGPGCVKTRARKIHKVDFYY